MTRDEFKKRLETLQEVILRAVASYEVMKKLRYHDEAEVDWTLDQQSGLQGRFKGFFTPVNLAMTDMTFIQFAKIFDPSKRTASFKILFDAALEDHSLLPHLSLDDLAEIRQDMEESKALVARLKRLRNQRLAHADANPLSVDPITLGELDKLAESIKTNFNRLSRGHDQNIIGWDFALRTSQQDTTAVLRVLIEHEAHRMRRLEDEQVQNGLDHLRRTEKTFGHRLDKQTIEEAIGTLGLTKEQMQRVEKEYLATSERRNDMNDNLIIAGKEFSSRLILGTGKYDSPETCLAALEASGTEIVTVAIRRLDLDNPDKPTELEYIDWDRYTILPNTAGSKTVEEALLTARLGRELTGSEWVKLEVIPDAKYLLPDPIGTLEAAETLISEGFTVLPYIHADPVLAGRLEGIGCATVMPLGSAIGSGQGILTLDEVKIIVEEAHVPVVVDAGIGAPSDAALAMEIGADAVLLNTAVALCADPPSMAEAMRQAVEAGRKAYLAGRIPKKAYASASSPLEGVVSTSEGPRRIPVS